MPGIVGIISGEDAPTCRHRLAQMIRAMRHDSGYESATCEATELGVYAGWVAHRGSAAVAECGQTGAGTNLVFAGECVSDTSDASGWSARPERNEGGSLLQLYERHGETAVRQLNGLFSGLIVDRPRGRAVLFNDRYGVERVYVHETADATYFASEAKALLAVAAVPHAFDDDGVAQFLAFGCPIDGKTLFRGIRLLEPASLWTFERGCRRKARYFTPAEWERQPILGTDEFQCEFESIFKRVLPRYLRGRSRLGVSLTGGLDTRMIMACLPSITTPLVTYTWGGLRGQTLDARIAARIAAECGLEHHVLRMGEDFLANYGDYVDRTVYVTDGCAGPTAAHEIYLNAQARRLAPVRLTGNFGSEVLRGMSTFKPLGLTHDLIAPDFRRHVNAAARIAPADGQNPVTCAAFSEIPFNLFGTMSAAKSQVVFRTPYLDNDLVGLMYQAPASVRQSPASALRLVQHAHPRLATIATDRAVIVGGAGVAYTLKRALRELTFKLDYMHKEDAPALAGVSGALGTLDKFRLLGSHKYLPYRPWFRNELAEYVGGALADAARLGLPFWNQPALTKFAGQYQKLRAGSLREINSVLTLAAVDRLLMRSHG